MRVALLHPEWDRPCSLCEKHVTNADGSFYRDPATSLPVLRSDYGNPPAPCHKCPKVPESVRASGADCREMRRHAVDLSEANRRAWAFYRECRATGRFPDDPLVRWYSAILRDVYDELDRRPAEELAAAIGSLVEALTKRRR